MAFQAPRHGGNTSARRIRRTLRRTAGLLGLAGLLAGSAASPAAAAPAAVGLGTAGNFAVLGGSTVTNTGPTVVRGDLGLSPGTAVTGFPPGQVLDGMTHVADAEAAQAQADLVLAYDDAASRPADASISGDLGGTTLPAGVYTSASSIGLTGDLTLDAQGDPNAVFIFQAGSDLTVGSGSRVLLQGGAQACNVFWQVGSSATIGTGSAFVGNILALTSITLTTSATLDGRALSRNGAVTLDTNNVARSLCTTPPAAGTPTGTAATNPGSPAPAAAGPPAGTTSLSPGTGTGVKKKAPATSTTFVRATLRVPRVCGAGSGMVAIKGRAIRRVDFLLDGRRIARVTRRDRSGNYRTRVRVARGQAARVSARVVFTKASGARTRILRLSVRRCKVARVNPRFTG